MRTFLCLVIAHVLMHFKVEISLFGRIFLVVWLCVAIAQDIKELRRK
jgi:hypothetical protein